MTPETPFLLDFQRICVVRGQKVALDDFSLRVRADEHIAILGPNGCGKSTLIKTITRECYPLAREESSMTVFGQPCWNVFELRSLLGVVANDFLLSCPEEASVREVVLSGFFGGTGIFSHHIVDAPMRELADRALERLQIGHLSERRIGELSSGEARRVLIARALVHNPRALLFDEPCNSLDLSAQRALRQTMRTLARSGIAIVLVTHELADIVPEIERVVLMREGRIVADGAKDEILRAERLSELFAVPVGITRRDGYYTIG